MRERMLTDFSLAPKILERILRVFPTERLDDRIEKDRFTAREVIAHLADYEQVILDRIRAANLQPGRTVPGFDPDQRAAEHHYGDKDVFHEAEVYESRRGVTIEYLQGLEDADWDKTFVHANGTTYTIRDYVALVFLHDLEHLDQISHYLATEVATINHA